MDPTTRTPIFGTDGVRGRALEGWLRPVAVEALGRAAGEVLGRGAGDARALLAHDGRRSAGALEAALARGFAAAGLGATTAGLLPTPGLAWLTRARGFRLGAMISASHNPAHDNGIKLFAGGGAKLSDEEQDAIEERLRDLTECTPAPADPLAGAPPADPSLEDAYLEHLVSLAAEGADLDGLTVALDCANGAGSRVGPRLLESLGASVDAVAASPDGDNINAGCGSTEPEALQARVRASGADVGVALDGDGDRCILVDERGELVDGDGIMTVVACDAMARGAWDDPRIVATVMSNRGLVRALREVGVGVVEVGVGDRRVVEGLRAEGLALGGEQSGHVVFGADNDYIGDGLLTALRVLGAMRRAGKGLAELAGAFQRMPQVLVNVPVREKPDFDSIPGVPEATRRAEAELGEDGRVLLRYSGTEPKARVMVEGPDPARTDALAHEVADAIAAAIGA